MMLRVLKKILLVTLISVMVMACQTVSPPQNCVAIAPNTIKFYEDNGVCLNNQDFKIFMGYVRDLEHCLEQR